MRLVSFATIVLTRIPLPSCGIALNIAGLFGLLSVLSEFHSEVAWLLLPMCKPLLALTVSLQGVLVLRAMIWWPSSDREQCGTLQIVGELHSTRAVSAYGALLIAVQLAWAHMYQLGAGTACLIVAHAASVGQYLLCARFLWLCFRQRKWPEPMWFPATVSLATPAIIAAQLGTPAVVASAALAAGVAVALIAWPLCVVRVLHDRLVAQGPVVFVQMAPVPFVTLAALGVLRVEHVHVAAEAPAWVCILLVVLVPLNIMSVLVTALAATRRWRSFRETLCPFQPAWAALTFPLVSSCLVAVLLDRFHSGVDGVERVAGAVVGASAPLSTALSTAPAAAAALRVITDAWARVLVPVTLIAVPLIDLLWLLELPRWVCRCCGGVTPRRFESVRLPDGEVAALLKDADSSCSSRGSTRAIRERVPVRSEFDEIEFT